MRVMLRLSQQRLILTTNHRGIEMSKIDFEDRGYTDKEIADRMEVMDILEDNMEEFEALKTMREIKEDHPGYMAFVMNFVSNKIRDEKLRNEFVTQYIDS